MKAAYMDKSVCDVCLNCNHEKCLDADKGCRKYINAVKAISSNSPIKGRWEKPKIHNSQQT